MTAISNLVIDQAELAELRRDRDRLNRLEAHMRKEAEFEGPGAEVVFVEESGAIFPFSKAFLDREWAKRSGVELSMMPPRADRPTLRALIDSLEDRKETNGNERN